MEPSNGNELQFADPSKCREILSDPTLSSTEQARFVVQEGETFASMYEGGGLVSNESTSANILAGATLGGGTRVNW